MKLQKLDKICLQKPRGAEIKFPQCICENKDFNFFKARVFLGGQKLIGQKKYFILIKRYLQNQNLVI